MYVDGRERVALYSAIHIVSVNKHVELFVVLDCIALSAPCVCVLRLLNIPTPFPPLTLQTATLFLPFWMLMHIVVPFLSFSLFFLPSFSRRLCDTRALCCPVLCCVCWFTLAQRHHKCGWAFGFFFLSVVLWWASLWQPETRDSLCGVASPSYLYTTLLAFLNSPFFFFSLLFGFFCDTGNPFENKK